MAERLEEAFESAWDGIAYSSEKECGRACFRAGTEWATEQAARTADAFGALAAGTAIRALAANTNKEQP